METRKIVRTEKAGVFFAEVKELNQKTATLTNARRLWYWEGAASLSQLAQVGTSKPSNCKFPVAVDEIIVMDVCEILSVTEVAAKTLDSVKVWSN